MLGLQTCSVCLWCDIKLTNLSNKGVSRTYKMIKDNFLKENNEGKQKKVKAKDFGKYILWKTWWIDFKPN